MSKNHEWIARQEQSEGSRRDYEYERLLVMVLDEVAEAMKHNHLSKADIARKLDVSRAHVTQTFSGERNLTLRSLSDVAWACGSRLCVKWQPMKSGEFISSPVSLVSAKTRVVTFTGDPASQGNPCVAADLIAAGGGI